MVQALQGLRYQFCELQSQKTGRKVELSDRITSIEYFEDILVPSISMKMEVISTVNLVSELMITGGEMVVMELETGSGRFKFGEVDGKGNITEGTNELYVYKVSAMDNQRQASKFTLHLVSLEYIRNETTRCMKRYGEDSSTPLLISDIVDEILLDTLDTSKDLFIEKTSNTYSFMGNMRKPFYTIQWLSPKSIAKGKNAERSGEDGEDGSTNAKANGTAGYLFFENKAGFHFRSIDGLVSSTLESSGSEDGKIISYDTHGTKQQPYEWRGMGAIDSNKLDANYQIINYIVERNTDVRKALITGMYINETQYFNVLTHEMSYYTYNLADEISDKKLGGDEVKDNIPAIPEVEVETSRYMYRISDHGSMGQGEDGLEASGGKNAERTDVAKSLARYNLLFTQSLNISIPLNVNIKVGDIMRCRFPNLNQGSSKEEDRNLSGKYLVRALRHHIEPNTNVTYVKLIRDSYGVSESKTLA
tara:strand:+ start:981 stop:2408 length:1428 start_codon:yes stop_codon:yes gene_type:complete